LRVIKPIGFVGCFLFLLAGASLAEAADLQITKAPPFLPPPPFSWTGFYLGGNVGAGFGTTETSVNVGPALTAVTATPVTATAPLVSETFNGFVGGIQAGYNWQAGVVVLGVEGDLDAAGLQGIRHVALCNVFEAIETAHESLVRYTYVIIAGSSLRCFSADHNELSISRRICHQ
jgi:opacity protein-like surface antigen